MPAKRSTARKHVHYHKDGTVWAKGQTVNGVPTGYWEWFRKDGTRMRSGYLEGDRQVGQWTTYDQSGRIYKVTTMKAKPTESKATENAIDSYLAKLPEDKRAALEKLRKAIRAAAPRAEETISYQLPAFRLEGRFLVAFGASARHCALYPGSSAIEAHKDQLKVYDTSKGTIRFQANRPLPAVLVRRLVQARIQDIVRRAGRRAGRPTRVRTPPVKKQKPPRNPHC